MLRVYARFFLFIPIYMSEKNPAKDERREKDVIKQTATLQVLLDYAAVQ